MQALMQPDPLDQGGAPPPAMPAQEAQPEPPQGGFSLPEQGAEAPQELPPEQFQQ
jgi:hypothetical protein